MIKLYNLFLFYIGLNKPIKFNTGLPSIIMKISDYTTNNYIDYVTIGSAGNGQDFGDLSAGRSYLSAVSSNTRGVFVSGIGSNTTMDYITIASAGNATDFGDCDSGLQTYSASASNSIRGVMSNSAADTDIQFITIATTGNSADFGDLSSGRNYHAGCGNAHGGIS